MLRIARPGPYIGHNRKRTQGCSKKRNTEDTNEDKVDIHGQKKKEVDLAKMTPAPTIEGLIKDFVQAKEAKNRPKADNQDKERSDKFENMLDDLGGKNNTDVHKNQEDVAKPDSDIK